MDYEQRFWAKVARRDDDACWEWTAARDDAGYGQFWNPRRRTMDLAHRVAFRLSGRTLEDSGRPGAAGQCVLHSCDNPPCVNPAHLFLGTQAENMLDMRAKGRAPNNAGERNPRARLTAVEVAKIRLSYTGIYGQKAALARQYGISTAQVSKILLARSWAA